MFRCSHRWPHDVHLTGAVPSNLKEHDDRCCHRRWLSSVSVYLPGLTPKFQLVHNEFRFKAVSGPKGSSRYSKMLSTYTKFGQCHPSCHQVVPKQPPLHPAVAWECLRKEAKWVASLDPKATPDEKDAIKKVCRCCLGQLAGPFVMLANVSDNGDDYEIIMLVVLVFVIVNDAGCYHCCMRASTTLR